MPRLRRYVLPGQPQHVIQRGNNRCPIFIADEDYGCFRHYLARACDLHGCHIHAYILITNHIHLLITPDKEDSISQTMQSIGRRYVQYFNHTYQRTGTLWEGRYKATLIDTEAYLLTCSRYIELNPVRANMVAHPADYRWSSFRANAYGEPDPLITAHAVYLAQHHDLDERQKHYQSLFAGQIDSKDIQTIRNAAQLSMPVGSDQFKTQIETALGYAIGHTKRGRPRIKEESALYSECE